MSHRAAYPYLIAPLLLACILRTAAPAATPHEPGFVIDLPLSGLGLVTALAFGPDGTLFLTEKTGAVKVLPAGAGAVTAFAEVPVYTESECGLLGIAVDPGYPGYGRGGYVYVFATVSSTEQRIIRFRDDAGRGADRLDIKRNLPTLGANHDGGCLKIGPDGKLYTAIGDGGSGPSKAQDVTNLFGKVLRLNLDGSTPDDNPDLSHLDAGFRREIYAHGFRNPFRLAIRLTGPGPNDFQVFANDVGSSGADRREEVNLVLPGRNHGWPQVEGFASPPNPLYRDPIHAYYADGTCIAAGAFYRGSLFPAEYVGNYFYMDHDSKKVFRMVLDGDAARSNTVFADVDGSVIDLVESPDGALFYSNKRGEVYRIRFEASGNQKPIAELDASPLSGSAPLEVTFDASGSSDSDGTVVRYDWTFGDSSSRLDGPVRVTHEYALAGSHVAQLTVRDNQGGSATARATITVGSASLPPVPEILLPEPGSSYDAGAVVEYSGTAVDPEDGELDGASLSWDVVLHHNDHTHPFVTAASGAAGQFRLPQAGIEENWSFRIVLTATDSSGRSASVERFVQLNYLPLSLSTEPPGLRLTVDGVSLRGPAAYQAVRGAAVELGAPSPQGPIPGPGGVQYFLFDSWSDAGPATHTVVMAPGLALTAVFVPAPAEYFLRGDANRDGRRDVSDAIYTLNFLFLGGSPIDCRDAADANDDGAIDITDAVAILGDLFYGTGPLPDPYAAPGLDPTDDRLGCQ